MYGVQGLGFYVYETIFIHSVGTVTFTMSWTIDYRVCKKCTDMRMDAKVIASGNDPVSGSNPEATDNGLQFCNLQSDLFLNYASLPNCGCVGVTVLATDPDLAAMTNAQKRCQEFWNDVDVNPILATKNCLTGLPLNPPMPPMP